MFDGTPGFKPADCVAVKLQSLSLSEPVTSGKAISRLIGTYTEPFLQVKKEIEVMDGLKETEPAPARPSRVLPLRRPAPSSPPPSRICEDDERRIMLKMEQLLKNEARVVEVEEENRVLTRMVMRLQAENDALKAK